MLLLPNIVYQLFTAGGSRTGLDDVEKSQPSTEADSGDVPDDDNSNFSPFPMPNDRPGVNQNDVDEETATHQYRFLPIFSGIMIPFSIMLSIPSLTGHWYIRTGDNDVTVEVRPNPLLLDLSMGLSMGCGVLASACLVVRFTERKVRLMTFACIVFLTLHGIFSLSFPLLKSRPILKPDIINIPAVTIFGIQRRFDDGFTYGQSFWMTVCSTLASTATNITLIIDYVRTKDFAQSGSGLTRKQRSLVIIIIILLCYISLGALIQTIMLEIAFIDALYFTVASIETVGEYIAPSINALTT
ncbi:hypothetical protein NLJ89_g10474 [Agrocybe chaxingu]|uniref:Uncharacterized protein n=1 Tax=Agrocybe chaxingu TaxID=84603 RepID=A0A9W8JRN5_9AGAR|nr:hypothetical protein NLJ89_g10474 [Agrocybe chaxingu]